MTVAANGPASTSPVVAGSDGRIRVVEIVATGSNGGAQEHLVSLLEGLDERRFEVRLLSLAGGSSVDRWRAAGASVEVIDTDDETTIALVADRLGAWGAQVIHAHMYRAEVVAALAALRLRARGLPRPFVIGHAHSSRIRSPQDQARLRALDQAIDRLVAVSRSIESKLRVERPAQPLIDHIANGVDVSRFARQGTRSGRRETSRPVVGCIARLEPEKGHETLLQAWVEVLAHAPRAPRLSIVGEGSCLGPLERLATRLGLSSEDVTFDGRRDDIPALIGAFDLVVLPSLREAQGLAILEAMAAARPVVASRVGGIVEVVDDGLTGLLVEPGDAAGLASAIVRVLEDGDLAARLGHAGQQRVRAHFGIEPMLTAIAALYEEGAQAWAERADVDASAGWSA